MPSREALRTMHAIKASDLAGAFNDAMQRTVIGPGEYVPELTAPEGQSTAGGKQAMQHLRLVPRLAGFPTLVVGNANHAEGKAELRSFAHVDAVHRQRFKRPVMLDRAGYEQFLPIARGFLEALRLATTIAGPPGNLAEADDAPLEPRSSTGSRVVTVSVVVALLFAVAAALWMALGRK